MRARSAITGSPPMVLPRQRPRRAFEPAKSSRGEQFAKIDGLAAGIGEFDADGVLARNDGNAAGDGAHRAGDVVGEADHPRRLDAGRRLELVERHHRPGTDIDDLAADAEVVEHALEQARVLLERRRADRGLSLRGLGLGEKLERRQFEPHRGARRRTACLLCRLRTRSRRGDALRLDRRRRRPPRPRQSGSSSDLRIAVAIVEARLDPPVVVGPVLVEARLAVADQRRAGAEGGGESCRRCGARCGRSHHRGPRPGRGGRRRPPVRSRRHHLRRRRNRRVIVLDHRHDRPRRAGAPPGRPVFAGIGRPAATAGRRVPRTRKPQARMPKNTAAAENSAQKTAAVKPLGVPRGRRRGC